MLSLPRRQKLAGGRLARRLFVLFVAAALLPLALSDWVSTRAVDEVVDALYQRSHERSTRQVSRAVLDRLITAGELLQAAPEADSAPASAPGLGTVFRTVERFGPGGAPLWSLRAPGVTTEPGIVLSPEAALVRVDEPTAVRIFIDSTPAPRPRLLMRAYVEGTLRAQGELDPRHVWGPVLVDNPDAYWRVRDRRGRTLLAHSGADDAEEESTGDDFDQLDGQRVATSQLPLAGIFGVGQWSFEQRNEREPVRWLGAELSSWLIGLACLTLFAAAFVGHWRIRRLFEPLEALTDGTRRLAAGDSGARVAIDSPDEIGALAGAFNDMALRIDEQLSALRAMASIDHDILTGEPLARIAERVVRQLATRLPEAAIVLSWRDGDERLQSCSADPATGSAGLLRVATSLLKTSASTAYASIDGDAALVTPSQPLPPWLPAAADGQALHTQVLPVRPRGDTVALLALGWPQEPPAARLQAAHELRDRLAVALAARAREQELLHRALHDSLTGLANRDGLSRRLDQLLGVEDADSAAPPLALLVVDLDHFKDINDSMGHGVGDQVLRVCAERLQACAPPPALVARLGGDEFVLLLPGAGADEALAVGNRVLDRLRQPLRVGDGDSVLGASIGIALGPLHGRTRLELLRRADIALYSAKRDGRGCQALFAEAMDHAAAERLQLQSELRRAIERREFVLHYQPRVRADSGVVTAVEALVRWQHPMRGLLPPAAFIDQVEISGLMGALGAQVLDLACQQAAAWRQSGLGLKRVSVNVSTQQLKPGNLPELVRQTLRRHQLPASMLELEVTESLLVQDVDSARRQLTMLRESGVTIALDDFGTGYSSMAMLRQLPIDVMKIDRAFVKDLDTDGGALAIASAIVSLAATLGLDVVAEGVETEGHAARLRALGCDELQGFLFSRPLAPAALERHVRDLQAESQRAHEANHLADMI